MSTCVRFSRLLSEAREPGRLLALLAEVAVEQLGAEGAAVLQVGPTGALRLVASRNLPEGLEAEEGLVAEMIGQELSLWLLGRCGGRFTQAHVVPLVGGHGLYGALVLLSCTSTPEQSSLRERLAQALADMAGAALDQAFYREELERALAQVQRSRTLLERTERLRAMGEMSAGIAHDLRNIFNPLMLRLASLRRQADSREQVLQEVEALEHVARRGLEIIERWRLFGQQPVEEGVVGLDTLVDEAVELLQPRLRQVGQSVLLKVIHGGPLLQARLRGSELVAALVNLLLNALEAMPLGGCLTVRTGQTREGRSWLRVEDTGEGMSMQVRERLFEPFFTTKGLAGTGLGLSMVYAFVQRSGGEITVESTRGQGSTFTLLFPPPQSPAEVNHAAS